MQVHCTFIMETCIVHSREFESLKYDKNNTESKNNLKTKSYIKQA
jgi:hypothetical protein